MAKKLRSQRRKKGNGDGKKDRRNGNKEEDHEMLSQEPTITALSIQGEDDFFCEQNGEWVDTDGLTSAGENGDATAVSLRESRLHDSLFGLDEFARETQSAKQREKRLGKLLKALTQCAVGCRCWEMVLEAQEHIRSACLYSLRFGKPLEQCTACHCLQAASIVLGANQDEWVDSLDKPLRRAVMMVTRATSVRTAALRALTTTVFICATDTETTERLMDLTELVACDTFRKETTPIELRVMGLDCWALLATTVDVDVFYLAGQDKTQLEHRLAMLSLLNECLDTTSIDLRAAAGECMTLIHEARLNFGVVADDDVEAGQEASECQVMIDEITQRIAQLSVESGHHMHKRVKKEQRATFRDFMSTIVDDEAPCEVISFRNHGSLTLGSWSEIIQVSFIRHCLQSGFQLQLLSNPTLQTIFGTDSLVTSTTTATGMSKLEKRLFMSKTSAVAKRTDRKMTRNRGKRENAKNHFLTADLSEIGPFFIPVCV